MKKIHFFQCRLDALSQVRGGNVGEWDTEAVKRGKAVKWMQIPWTPVAKETAASIELSFWPNRNDFLMLWRVTEAHARDPCSVFPFNFPARLSWSPCTHGSGFWFGFWPGVSFLFWRLCFGSPALSKYFSSRVLRCSASVTHEIIFTLPTFSLLSAELLFF